LRFGTIFVIGQLVLPTSGYAAPAGIFEGFEPFEASFPHKIQRDGSFLYPNWLIAGPGKVTLVTCHAQIGATTYCSVGAGSQQISTSIDNYRLTIRETSTYPGGEIDHDNYTYNMTASQCDGIHHHDHDESDPTNRVVIDEPLTCHSVLAGLAHPSSNGQAKGTQAASSCASDDSDVTGLGPTNAQPQPSQPCPKPSYQRKVAHQPKTATSGSDLWEGGQAAQSILGPLQGTVASPPPPPPVAVTSAETAPASEKAAYLRGCVVIPEKKSSLQYSFNIKNHCKETIYYDITFYGDISYEHNIEVAEYSPTQEKKMLDSGKERGLGYSYKRVIVHKLCNSKGECIVP
jgi:hypothetical protein